MAKNRRKFSEEEVIRILERFDESGLATHAFAEKEGLDDICLYQWRKWVIDPSIDWLSD